MDEIKKEPTDSTAIATPTATTAAPGSPLTQAHDATPTTDSDAKPATIPTSTIIAPDTQSSATSPASSTTTTSAPTLPTSARLGLTANPHRPQVLVAKILAMLLDNSTAIAEHRLRPHTLSQLNRLRAQLLEYSFFSADHQPHELRPRLRTSRISFADTILLMARLFRVILTRGPLSEEDTKERIEVRNACLDQPFFKRSLVGSARPFVDDDGFHDEGCDVSG